MQKKLTLSFLMAGLICTSYTPTVHAGSLTNKAKMLIAATLVLIPSVWQYTTKKEVLKRYDLEELKSFKNVLDNLYYLYLDGVWGTPPKSESIKLKGAEGGEVIYEKSPKRDGSGIIGTIHTNNKNVLTVSAWVAAFWALIYSDKILGQNEIINWAKLYNIFKDPAEAVKLYELK